MKVQVIVELDYEPNSTTKSVEERRLEMRKDIEHWFKNLSPTYSCRIGMPTFAIRYAYVMAHLQQPESQ